MRNFRLTISRDGSRVALITHDVDRPSDEAISVYDTDQLYPLSADRYHRDMPNVFIDVLDTVDGFGPAATHTGKEKAALSYPDITVRTLARRAARAVTDGSGKVDDRFNDARTLWQRLQQHALAGVVRMADEPIIDVRRGHNWRKNQPLASVRADPQAWYVTRAFSRSNKGKDELHAFRGLTAVLDVVCAQEDKAQAGTQTQARAQAGAHDEVDRGAHALSVRKSVLGDLNYPTYRQVASLVADSNMLVFHNDADFAQWIRHESGHKEGCVESGTPIVIHLRSSRGAQIVPGDVHTNSTADFDGISSGSAIPISAFANRLAPRIRRSRAGKAREDARKRK